MLRYVSGSGYGYVLVDPQLLFSEESQRSQRSYERFGVLLYRFDNHYVSRFLLSFRAEVIRSCLDSFQLPLLKRHFSFGDHVFDALVREFLESHDVVDVDFEFAFHSRVDESYRTFRSGYGEILLEFDNGVLDLRHGFCTHLVRSVLRKRAEFAYRRNYLAFQSFVFRLVEFDLRLAELHERRMRLEFDEPYDSLERLVHRLFGCYCFDIGNEILVSLR